MATSATQTLVDVQLIEGWWTLKIAKGWICLSRDEIVAGLRRGKRLKRRVACEARSRDAER